MGSRETLGKLFLELGVDPSGLQKDLKKALGNAEKTLKRTGAGLQRAGKKMTLGITAPLVAVGAAVLKTSGDFEAGMKNVNSLLDLPESGLKDLSKTIRQVSSDLGVDLVGQTEAAYQAISAGVKKDDLGEFLRTASRAAIAGVAETSDAVTVLTKTMDAYGDASVDVETLADQLFATVKGGVTTFQELSQALPNAAGMAAALRVESSELLGVLARTTKVSESTSGAVTRISSAMAALLKPSAEMTKLFAEAGIESAKAAIETDGLTDTLLKLVKAAPSEGVLAKAFGRKEAILLIQDLILNTEKWREQIDSVADSSGAMGAAFLQNNSGLNRSLEKLKVQFVNLGVVLGDTGILEMFTGFLDKITRAVKRLSESNPGLLKFGVILAGAAAVLGPLVAGLGFMATGLSAIAAIGAGPILAIGAAFAGLAALILPNLGSITQFAEGLFGIGAAADGVSGPLTELQQRGREFRDQISEAFGSVKDRVSNAVDGIQSALQPLTDGISRVVDNLREKFNAWVSENPELVAMLGASWESLKDAAVTAFTALSQTLGNVWEGIKTGLETLGASLGDSGIDFETLLEVGVKSLTGIVKGVTALLDIASIVFPKVGAFLGKLIETWAELAVMAKDMADAVAGAFSRIVAAVDGAADKLFGSMAKITDALSSVTSAGQRMWKEAFGGSWARDFFDSMFGGASLFRGEFEKPITESLRVVSKSGQLIDGLGRNLSRAFQTGRFEADVFLNTVTAHFADVAVEGIKSMLDLEKGTSDSLSNMSDQFSGWFTWLTDAFSNVGSWIGDLLGGIGGTVSSIVGGLGSSVGGIVSSALSLFSFDGGGFTGGGSRSGGLDGRGGFAAMLHPNETVIDHTLSSGPSGSARVGSPNVVVNLTQNFPQSITEAQVAGMINDMGTVTVEGIFEAFQSGGPARQILRGAI